MGPAEDADSKAGGQFWKEPANGLLSSLVMWPKASHLASVNLGLLPVGWGNDSYRGRLESISRQSSEDGSRVPPSWRLKTFINNTQ